MNNRQFEEAVVRVACYINQIPMALGMVKDAHDKGYETAVNLMSVSTVPERQWDESLDLPYMLCGFLNQHPRAAIKYNAAVERGDIVKFYDTLEEP